MFENDIQHSLKNDDLDYNAFMHKVFSDLNKTFSLHEVQPNPIRVAIICGLFVSALEENILRQMLHSGLITKSEIRGLIDESIKAGRYHADTCEKVSKNDK